MKKKFEPLVSIICNCYNGDRYLLKALKSITHQTYKNWELIFWDVSSNNKSKKIYDTFKDKRFRYYRTHKKNKNLYHSRDDAIKKAKGEILAFIDCDDWWVETKLEKQVPFFTNKSVNFVYSNVFFFHENSKRLIKFDTKKIYSGLIQKKLLSNYQISILTTMFRKNIYKKLSGYNKNFHINGDFEFNIRFSKKYKIIGLKEPLGFYRVHSNNISKNYELEIAEFENCLKIFKNNKISNSDLKNFKNYIIYKKFLNYLHKNEKLNAFLLFLKLNLNILKLKAFLLFFIPKIIVNKLR